MKTNSAYQFHEYKPGNSCQNLNQACTQYHRSSQLPKLLGLWPHELEDYSDEGTFLILEKLRKALRAERQRGRSGHWSYDLNRHMALLDAIKHETSNLEKPLRDKR